MSKVHSFRWADSPIFRQHPVFAYEYGGLIYMWRYDLDREAMLNQCAGSPCDGKSVEDHANAYINRIQPRPNDLYRKTIETIPGKFHPRIYRPGAIEDNFKDNGCPVSDSKAIGQSLVSTSILLGKLKSILETIELANENLEVFGHEIRNLLLLSCMEVESTLSAILRENKYPQRRWTTNDYVKLRDPLHLEKYEVKFKLYPSFNAVLPFKGWDAEKPTQSLSWYDAYNNTKHDRELNINKATLRHAVLSVSAVASLLHAQFGPNHDFWKQGELSNITVGMCHEFDVDEFYIPHSTDKNLQCKWESQPLAI